MNIQKSGVGLSSPSWITTAKVLVVLPIRQVGLKEAENLSVAKVIGRWFGLSTWWFIPLSKWVVTQDIHEISRVNPLVTGVVTHLLTGMNHQAWLSYSKKNCTISGVSSCLPMSVKSTSVKVFHWENKIQKRTEMGCTTKQQVKAGIHDEP